MMSSSRILLVAVLFGSSSIGCSAAKNNTLGAAGTTGASGPSSAPSADGAGTGADQGSGSGGAAATPGAQGGTAGSSSGAKPAMGSPAGTGGAGSQPAMVVEKLDPNVDWTALKLVYSPMYSAYDGKHTFKVPVHVDGTTVELSGWRAIPSSAVIIDPDPGVAGGVMVTVLQAVPEITIAASNGSIGGTAPLRITSATPDEWAVGEARYYNGVDFTLMVDFSQILNPNWMPPPPPPNLACNNCHSTGAKYFEIQHTPTQEARFSDDDLTTIFTKGMKPSGIGFRLLPAMIGAQTATETYAQFHKWDATPAEVKGLIVYLRSLTPTGQGDILLPNGTYVAPGSVPSGFGGASGSPGAAGASGSGP